MTVLVGARQHKRKHHHDVLIIALFAPIHLAYALIILMGVVPQWSGSADCSHSMLYPRIMIANDVLFAAVFVISLVFHRCGYFMEWDIVSDDEARKSIEAFEKNEIQKMRKEVFK